MYACSRTNLHGANIYRDSCTIKVEFAKQDVLNVKTNDDRTWDYTVTGQTKVNGQVNGGNHLKVIKYSENYSSLTKVVIFTLNFRLQEKF